MDFQSSAPGANPPALAGGRLVAFPSPHGRKWLLEDYLYTVENPIHAIRQLAMLVHPDRRQLSGARALPDDVLLRLDEWQHLLQQRLRELKSEAPHFSKKADPSWPKVLILSRSPGWWPMPAG